MHVFLISFLSILDVKLNILWCIICNLEKDILHFTATKQAQIL